MEVGSSEHWTSFPGHLRKSPMIFQASRSERRRGERTSFWRQTGKQAVVDPGFPGSEGGHQSRGALTYYLAYFLPKSYWKWKKWTQKGARDGSLTYPLTRYTNDKDYFDVKKEEKNQNHVDQNKLMIYLGHLAHFKSWESLLGWFGVAQHSENPCSTQTLVKIELT